ncbi:hypothetical protein QFC19_004829 [Naganishia cerealis]|uniref:Uncharacterized protein n=1 Tax=Naganishia cerealis TaxID=610337 RepID=A0ACC2VUG5_9TREE|nr:hypothetical protein QFC19_004829 [Naganishia cerealis]
MALRILHSSRRLPTQGAYLQSRLCRRFSTTRIVDRAEVQDRQPSPATTANNPGRLADVLQSYRLATAPLPTHLQKKASSSKGKFAEARVSDDIETLLKNQRRARNSLKLYNTLTAKELPVFYADLNNLDVKEEIQPQEHDTISAVANAAKNDSKWSIEVEPERLETHLKERSTSVGKRLSKVYRFHSWTLAATHFWRRVNECFEQQDHHPDINIRLNPDTKLTEVRVALNTHTPKALPPPKPLDLTESAQPNTLQSDSRNATGSEPPHTEKPRIQYGPPALTRKDFILAWSIDMAAFRARQKEFSLERRHARRTAKKELDMKSEQQVGNQSDSRWRSGDETEQQSQASARSSGSETGGPSSMFDTPTMFAKSDMPSNSPSTADANTKAMLKNPSGQADVQTTVNAENSKSETTTSVATKTPRRRHLSGDGLSLQHFLSRTQILAAYRNTVRATKTLPDPHTRRETLDWLRQDLEKLKGVTDLPTIKEALAAYKRDSKHFIPSVGLSTISAEGQVTAPLIGRK